MFKSGILVMMITLVSRVLGLFRTILIAYYFGASKFTDAYFSAFKISNLFRQVLGEGALGTVFIPLYNERIQKEGEEKGKVLIYSILNLLFVVTTILSLLTVIFSKEIIEIIVRGYPEETKEIASGLLKIMAFYLLFIGMSGMISAILNNFKRFLIPASTSLLFNVAVIASASLFSEQFGIEALAAGVLVGGVLQFLVVLPSFFGIVKGYSFKIDFKDPYLKRIFLLLIPMLLGIFARQINSVVDQFFASYLKSGGVTALENATRLYNLPLGVFGISLATVVYPTMSRAMERKDFAQVEDKLIKGMNILMFLILPSMAVFTMYSVEVIELVFSRGRYSPEAILVTSQSLLFYSLGLYFYTGTHLISRAYYGMKNTKDPVKFSIISILINICLNALLIGKLRHMGLALATAVASGVNFTMLLIYFRRKYLKIDIGRVGRFTARVAAAVGISLLTSFFIENTILKLVVFSAVYLGVWAVPLKRRGVEIF